MKIILVSIIFGLPTTVLANVEADALFLACLKLAGPYNYDCDGRVLVSPGYMASPCNCYSSAFLASYVDCINSAKNGNKERALKSLVTNCAESNTRHDLSTNYLKKTYLNETNNFIESTSYNNKTVTSNPLRFPQAQIDLYFRSYRSKTYSTYSSQLYGYVQYFYFIFF